MAGAAHIPAGWAAPHGDAPLPAPSVIPPAVRRLLRVLRKEQSMKMLPSMGLTLRRSTTFAAGLVAAALVAIGLPAAAVASELDLKIPVLDTSYTLFGATVSGLTLLY